jgi:diguanylate cyclase (GGDEF)-like protein
MGRGFMPARSAPRLGGSYSSAPFVGPDPLTSRLSRQRSVFLTYVLVEILLWALALALPHPSRGYVSTAAGALGITIFVVYVARLKPTRLIGWWLVAAGSLALFAAGIITALRYGLSAVVAESPPAPLTLVALSLLLMAAGLTVLGWRRDSAAGVADVLDATMAAAGAALLVWALTTDVADPPSAEPRFVVLVVLPLGAALVFAAAIKLVLSAGLRTPAITLLALAAAVLVAASLDVVIPTTDGFELISGRATKLLWTAHGTLLGAVALHPSFTHATRDIALGDVSLSPWRIALFAVTAVVVPLAVAVGFTAEPDSFSRSAAGIAIPTATAAAVLLSLLGRLALAARVSQRRAAELARRSVALMEALDRQEELRQELAYRAMHDPLTGLSNRVVLAERLEWALTRRGGSAHPALLLVDLDGFKDINDTYGHPIGDDLLSKVSQRLQAVAPDTAVVARLGGDEFAILVDVVHSSDAVTHAEAVLSAIQRPFYVDDQEMLLSASIGLLVVDSAEASIAPSEALRDADLALYAAKSLGKNRAVTFEPRMRSERLERVRLSAGLQRTLSHGELRLSYQPIVGLATGQILAVEVLVRWRPPGGDPIPPGQFIPVAEATELIGPLGARVLRQACLDACRWNEQYGVAVCVNVSGQQLDDPGFVDMVVAMLAECGMPGSALILELTENSLVGTASQRPETRQLGLLREHGIRIALENFGAGHSSLGNLSELPADIVKLDRSLTRGHDSTASGGLNWAFTGTVLQAIASAGLAAVAEGVETPEQVRALRSLHCPYGQGFLFSRPVSLRRIEQILAQPASSRVRDG